MRKIITLSLSFVLMFSCVNVLNAASEPAEATAASAVHYFVNEDFSNVKTLEEALENSSTLSYDNRKGKVSVTETFIEDDDPIEGDIALISDGYALRSEVTVSTDYDDMPYIMTTLPTRINSGKVVVETRMRSFEPIANYMVVLRDSDGAEMLSAVYRASQELTISTATAITWKEGEWYDIKFVLDFDKRVIDGYVNGELCIANYLPSSMKNLDNVFFRGWITPPNDGAAEIKYIKVYSEETEETDAIETIIDEKYAEQLTILKMLGIWSDDMGVFEPEKKVVRGEFAKVMSRFYGLADDEIVASQEAAFSDIDENSPIKKYVDYVLRMGLMNGKGDGLFAPDDFILCQEAVKTMICALNYETIAQTGGYPSGYLSLAHKIDLFKNVDAIYTEALSYGDFVTLLYNALTVDFPLPDSIIEDQLVFRTQEDVNVLTEYFDMYIGKGIVNANERTSLISPDGARGSIVIGKDTFTAQNGSFNAYLGMHVKYYYVLENGEKILKYVLPYKSNVIEVTADDINRDKTIASAGERFYYYENDGKDSEDIPLDKPYIIYNGKAYDGAVTGEIFCPRTGNITLIDNNHDNECDVVIIKDYRNVIVEAVNTKDKIIYGMFGEKIELAGEISVTYRGNMVELAAISSYDVVAVGQSVNTLGKSYVSVEIIKDKVNGTISQASEDSVFINEKEYKFSKTYLDYVLSGQGELPVVGDGGIFYLDADGKIIYPDLDKNSYDKTGYLIKLGEKGGLSENLKMKILDASGKVSVLETAEKVFVNGIGKKSTDELKSILSQTAMAGEYDQLIRYRIGSDGYINRIDTDCFDVYNPDGLAHKEIATEYYYASKGYVFYRNVEFALQKPFTVNKRTVAFYVPSLDSEDKKYSTATFDSVASNFYEAEAYNLSDAGCAEYVVLRSPAAYNSETSVRFLVEKVVQVVLEDGEYGYKVSGYVSGNPATITIGSEQGIAIPQTGDIIRYINGNDGLVAYLRKELSAPTVATEDSALGGYGETDIKRYGKMTYADEDSLIVNVSGVDYPFSTRELYGNITVIDMAEKEVRREDIGKISTYTVDMASNARVFLAAYQGMVTDFYVYLLEE